MRAFKLVFVFVLIALLSSALLPTQAQGDKPKAVGLRPDAPPYALHGPYWIGTREFVIPDKAGKRPLPGTIWYPALNPDGKPEATSHTDDYSPVFPKALDNVRAIQDAAPDMKNGPYPLVIYSHQNLAQRHDSLDYTEHLASYGFVVIAIDHTGNTAANSNDPPSLETWLYRPRDISRAIDYAESLTAKGGTLNGLIDTKHVATTGYLFGGWTVLLSAGARWDFGVFSDFCTKNPKSFQASEICGVNAAQKELATLLGLGSVPTGLWPALGDPRVTAILPFTPYSAAPMFGPEGLKEVRIPALFMAAPGLSRFPMPNMAEGGAYFEVSGYDTAKAYEYMGSQQKSLVVLENAGGWIFSNSWTRVPPEVLARFNEWTMNGVYYFSDPVWDMDRAHDLINHFTTAFLLDVLKGDKEAHKALLPDAVKFVGIQYKTTLK